MKQEQALINGQLITIKEHVKIINPTTLTVIGSVPALHPEQIATAFKSAAQAQPAWANLLINERIKFIEVWKELIYQNREELAALMVLEIAKTKKASLIEIQRTIEYLEQTIQEAYRLYPETYTGEAHNIANKLAIFKYVPKGVILAISPFNYPVNLSLSKIIPALVTGNTVVFKPASQSSLTGLFLAKLAHQANFPAGVFNAVTGKGSVIGDILVTDPNIKMISFTGSDIIGNHIAKLVTKVDLVLELGGKDAAIVLPDCDLKATASKIIKGAFNYSGQRCTAIKRVLVDNNTADKLIPYLKAEIELLTVGKPEDNSYITPVVDLKTAEMVQGLIDEALKKEARLIIGNKREKNLMWPTLIDNVTEDMQLAWVEPFAPVLPIIRVDSYEEAILINNRSQYGIQASIFTQDIDLAYQIAWKLEVGSVNINEAPQRGPDYLPFLGVKNSGMGVQGIRDALLSMTRKQGIVFNWKK